MKIVLGVLLGLLGLVWIANNATVSHQQAAAKAETIASELAVKAQCRRGGFDNVMVWTVTATNKSQTALGDLSYRTAYAGETDTVMHRGKGVVPVKIEPGKTRRFEVNDGFVPKGLDRCSFEIVDTKRLAAATKK